MTKTASKQRTQTDFLCLTISAGGGVEFTDERGLTRYRYSVRLASDATGAKVSFKFFDSAHRHDQAVDQLDRKALLEAFWSFVMDASAGEMPVSEFCDEFGYDPDSVSARRLWASCKASLRKFQALWHDDREPSWALEQLAAIGVE